jgi:hypothetical protein
VAVDISPVASKSPELTGSPIVQTASRLVTAIQSGPVSVPLVCREGLLCLAKTSTSSAEL